MAINYTKAEEIISKHNDDPYRQISKLERLLGSEAVVGKVLWKLAREGKIDLSASTRYWSALYSSPKKSYDATDVARLLEGIGKQDMEDLLDRWERDTLDGWDFYLDQLLKNVADKPAAVLKIWKKLPEPLRTGAGFALAQLGLAKTKELPSGTLDAVAKMTANSISAAGEADKLTKIFAKDKVGKALAKAAATEGTEIWSLDFMEQYASYATADQVARIALNVDYESVVKPALELLDSFGKKVEAPLTKLVAKKTHDPAERGLTVAGIWLAKQAAAKGRAPDAAVEKALAEAVKDPSKDYITELAEALRALPEPKREKILLPVITQRAGNRWPLVAACQTPKLLDKAIASVNAWGRKEPYQREKLLEAFGSLGFDAAAPLIAALAKPVPQRAVLVTGLAATKNPIAIPKLAEMLGDSIAEVQEIATAGLISQGAASREAMVAALSSGKKQVRLGAARVLAAVGITAEMEAAVEQASKKEKVAEIKKLLSSFKKQAADAPVAASIPEQIETLRAGISKADKKAIEEVTSDCFWGEGTKRKRDQRVKALGKKHGLSFFVGAYDKLSDYWLEPHQLERSWFAFIESTKGNHPILPWLTVSLLGICSLEEDEDDDDAAKSDQGPRQHYQSLLERAEKRFGADLKDPLQHHVLATPSKQLQRKWRCADELFSWCLLVAPEDGLELILTALDHKKAELRERGKWALVELGATALPIAHELLQEATKASIREIAVDVIAEIGDPSSTPVLEAALEAERSKATKKRIADLLFELQQAEATPIAELDCDAKSHAALDKRLADQPPSLPKKLDLKKLPPISWRSGAKLTTGARAWLLTQLSQHGPKQEDPNLVALRDHLDPDSAAKLLDALQKQFGPKSKEGRLGWVLFTSAVLASEEQLADFGKDLDEKARFGSSTEAFYQLEVLRRHGSMKALTWIEHWSRKARSRGLRDRAISALDELAEKMGLSREEVAEQLVPDFGFALDGTRALAYGTRSFTLRLGASNAIQIETEDGKLIKSLPAPKKGENANALKKVKQELSALKKQVKQASKAAIDRLEQALVTSRRWSAPGWQACYLSKPLLRNLAYHLLWMVEVKDGWKPFRVGEEQQTIVDINNRGIAFRKHNVLALAHPLLLNKLTKKERKLWSDFFFEHCDQPFPQLERPVFSLEKGEKTCVELDRYEDDAVSTGALRGHFERGQWLRGEPQDGGGVLWYLKPFGPAQVTAVVDLDPGFSIGYADMDEDQQIRSAMFLRGCHESRPYGLKGMKLKDVDPIVLSEVIYDLDRLVARGR